MSAENYLLEKTLLAAVAKGDALAFGRIYEQYRRKVYTISLRLLGSEAEAEDVHQEIFIKIWLQREKLLEIEYFNSYLNTLIRNHIYNALRKKSNQNSYLRELLNASDADSDEAFKKAESREIQKLLHQAIDKLPKQQKKVFELVRIEGRPQGEAAEALSISKETVKKHLMGAQRTIAAFFRNKNISPLLILLLIRSIS